MCNNQYTLAAFLHVTSAYDNIVYNIRIEKLIELGCPKNIDRFISKWLYYKKTQFVIDNKETCDRIVRKELPQGAVLSPVFYIYL